MIELADVGNDRLKQHDELRTKMTNAGIKFTPRLSFANLLNAISVDTAADNIERIKSLDNVIAVWTLKSIARPHESTVATVNQIDAIHEETGVKELHEQQKYNGNGIKVGVVDSGIDYTHPALGGCFGPGCRVAYGYDFVGDNFTGIGTQKPDEDPRDTCNGHGTHVAGIIGGNDTKVTGVAPAAILGAYRVFGCQENTDSDFVIAGMERAYVDGMDIVNLSIVSPVRWADAPDGLAADRLAQRGIIVVAAAGNDGTTGLWATSSPALSDNALSVTALDSSNVNIKSDYTIEYLAADPGHTLNFTNVPFSLVDTNNEYGCNALVNNYTGHVMLVKRGGCVMDDKARIAKNAGAIAVVVYNNVDGPLQPKLDNPTLLPLVGINSINGNALVEAIKTKPDNETVFTTFEADARYVTNPNGNQVSTFASWGPGPMLEIKPDIGAPGGQIYSTYPLTISNGYATLSGTSMASPYIAGSIALYLQAYGKTNVTAAHIREAFQNAGKPTVQSINKHWITSSVARQGAGMINVKQALISKTRVTPSRLALNDTQQQADATSTIQKTITILNNDQEAKTYRLRHQPALSVQSFNASQMVPATPLQKRIYAAVTFSTQEIQIPAGESRDITVTIRPPRSLPEAERWVYSGYLSIDPTANSSWRCHSSTSSKDAVYVPYLGMKGRLRDIHVFNLASNYPFLRNLNDNTQIALPNETATYSMKNYDFPWVYIRLEYATRLSFVRIYSAETKQLLGIVPNSISELLSRNDDTPDNYELALPWTGDVESLDDRHTVSDLPNGRYYLTVLALRPLGDHTLDNDYDIWQSPTVSIQRETN
ncbi:peptidase S8/S53 domain-containing protein [Syncephalis fuscata]|nr:peptidase S8/S53 domain-containing protein [Syncephalis fuscata]